MQGTRFDPWSGKMPLRNEVRESQLPKLSCPRAHALQQEMLPQWEAHALQLKSNLHSQLEKALLQ